MLSIKNIRSASDSVSYHGVDDYYHNDLDEEFGEIWSESDDQAGALDVSADSKIEIVDDLDSDAEVETTTERSEIPEDQGTPEPASESQDENIEKTASGDPEGEHTDKHIKDRGTDTPPHDDGQTDGKEANTREATEAATDEITEQSSLNTQNNDEAVKTAEAQNTRGSSNEHKTAEAENSNTSVQEPAEPATQSAQRGQNNHDQKANEHSTSADTGAETAAKERTKDQWYGQGATALGLTGGIKASDHKAILEGRLPDGSQLGRTEKGEIKHHPGVDLVFSMPKSASLLALLGRDNRIREAHIKSVQSTLDWAEKKLITARVSTTTLDENGNRETVNENVKTGKIVALLFEHLTSRADDPDIHLHTLIANVTVDQSGTARSVDNRLLWQSKGLLAAIQNRYFAKELEAIGYDTVVVNKYGQSEIANFDRQTIEKFSKRGNEIREIKKSLTNPTQAALEKVALKTRPKKTHEKLSVVVKEWQERAKDIGFDAASIVEAYKQKLEIPAVQTEQNFWKSSLGSLKAAGVKFGELIKRFFEPSAKTVDVKTDPYAPQNAKDLTPGDVQAHSGVSWAVRHLSEREAGFKVTDLLKAALSLGGKYTIIDVEKAVERLKGDGLLIEGNLKGHAYITTKFAIETEKSALAEVEKGKNTTAPLLGEGVLERLEAKGLNAEQLKAADAILHTPDRFHNIQGVGGSGKTSYLLKELREEFSASELNVIGLAHKNEVVRILGEDAQITGITITTFLNTHKGLLDPNVSAAKLDFAKWAFKESVIVVDETSEVGNNNNEQLNRLANLLEVRKIIKTGDIKQGHSIDAGKAFELEQAGGAATSVLSENKRQKNEDLKRAADLAHAGRFREANDILAAYTEENAKDFKDNIADRWKEFTRDGRNETIIVTPTRQLRDEINGIIHDEERKIGRVTGDDVSLRLLEAKNLTKPELEHVHSFEQGNVIEFNKRITAGVVEGRISGYFLEAQQSNSQDFITKQGTKAQFEKGSYQNISGKTFGSLDIEEDFKKYIKLTDPETGKSAYFYKLGRNIIDRGTIATVTDADPVSGIVSALDAKTGSVIKFKPDVITGEKDIAPITLYVAKSVTIGEGDAIRFTAPDKDRGINTSSRGLVVKASADEIIIKTDTDKAYSLNAKDPLRQRIDLGYAYTAQGATGFSKDSAIAVLNEAAGKALSGSSFYITISREKENLAIITDNRESVIKQVIKNTGISVSALEVLNERPITSPYLESANNDLRPTTILSQETIQKYLSAALGDVSPITKSEEHTNPEVPVSKSEPIPASDLSHLTRIEESIRTQPEISIQDKTLNIQKTPSIDIGL